MINIPYDAEKVVFELQSENVAMYVNVYLKGIMKYEEYKYPSKTYHSWDFYSKGKPQLFELSKNDILEEANNEIDSLEAASLTVCIEAQNQDNDLSSIYALKYSLELNSALNIYELYSDQQTLCQTEKIAPGTLAKAKLGNDVIANDAASPEFCIPISIAIALF